MLLAFCGVAATASGQVTNDDAFTHPLHQIFGDDLALLWYSVYSIPDTDIAPSLRHMGRGPGQFPLCCKTTSLERLVALSGYDGKKTMTSGAFFQSDQLPSQGNLTVEADRSKILMLEDSIRRVYCVFAIKQAVSQVRGAASSAARGSVVDVSETDSSQGIDETPETGGGDASSSSTPTGSMLNKSGSIVSQSFRRVASLRKRPVRNISCMLDGKQLKCAETGFLVKMLEADQELAGKISTMSLRNNALADDGMHVVLRDLCAKEAGANIRTLDLSGNQGISTRGAQLLGRYLATGKARLGIIGLAETGIGAEGGKELAGALKTTHSTLAELNIENTGQDDASVTALIEGMAAHGRVLVRVKEAQLSADVLNAWQSQCRENVAASSLQ